MSAEQHEEPVRPEVTRTFPTGRPRALDPSVFRDLLRDAAKAYLGLLARTEPRTFGREVFRPKDDGVYSVDVRFPLYRWDHQVVENELDSPGLKSLLDYLWDHGQPAVTLTGPDPQRRNWAFWVLANMVHVLVSRALNDAAFDEAIDTSAITPWRLPGETLEGLLEGAIARWCQGEHRYLAKCPVGYVDMKPGEEWQLAEGIKLRCYTPRELVGHLSKNHYNILWRDSFSFSFREATMLEIAGTYDPTARDGRGLITENDIAEEAIADKLDLAKWALMAVFGEGPAVKEGWITYELASDTMPLISDRSFLRQGFFLRHFTGGGVYTLDSGRVERVRELLTRALRLRSKSRDLKHAFFYWGRSAVSELDRDQLLDAAVGLDDLLAKGGGDSSYRFRLHGTALLARFAESAEACYEELKEVYNARSSAAHGNPGGGHEAAPKARRLLGNAIVAIMDLAEAGTLDLSKGVAKEIEKLVLKSTLILAPKRGPEEELPGV